MHVFTCHKTWQQSTHLVANSSLMGIQYLISSHLSPLTLTVVGAPKMTLQQYISTFPCRPLPSGNLKTPFLSTLWCYLVISSSVFLSFLLLSLSPAEPSSPEDLAMLPYHLSFRFFNIVRSSCTPTAFWILLRTFSSSHDLWRKCSEVSYNISSQGLGSFFRVVLSVSSSHRHKGSWIRWAFALA